MNKAIAALVAAIIIIGGGALIYSHNHKSKTTNNQTSSNTTASANNTTSSNTSATAGSNASSGSGSTAPATSAVTINNFAFSPSSLSVKKGTKVTWTNKDSVTHHVAETDSQTGPDSGNLSPGGTYSFTYNTAGTFHYHCAIHTEMTGTVTVTQ